MIAPFLFGVFVGAQIGFVVASLMVAASRADGDDD